MHQQSPSTSTSKSYSIKEAAALCGVSVDTIKRRLADDRFPTANQQAGRTGPEWQIPADELASVANEDGWTFDLAAALPQQEHQQGLEQKPALGELVDQIKEETAARAEALALLQQSTSKAEQLEKQLHQAQNDVEHWRAEHKKLEAANTELDKDKAVAEARTDEIRQQLENEQNRVAEKDAELISVGERSTELQKESAERLSALAETQESLDDTAKKLKEAEASMGWWTRRRYEKSTGESSSG